MLSRERKGHPGYAAVWKGHRTSTPGGLHKEDIMRVCIKGPAKGPKRYKYISRARHALGMQRKREGLPLEFAEYKIPKKWSRCAGRR